MEEWRAIPGYGNHYEASSDGRIKSRSRVVVKRHSSGKTMNQHYPERIFSDFQCDKDGYSKLHISVGGKKETVLVHRMVLLAFDRAPKDGELGLHRNGDPSDNSPLNLYWGTHQQNMIDRKRHGNYAVGDAHPMAKLSAEQALEIKTSKESGVLIARRIGISQQVVSNIRVGKTWRHI